MDDGAEANGHHIRLERAVFNEVQVDQVVYQAEHLLCRDKVDLEEPSLLGAEACVAELLSGEDDGVEGSLDLVGDRRVQDLVDVT